MTYKATVHSLRILQIVRLSTLRTCVALTSVFGVCTIRKFRRMCTITILISRYANPETRQQSWNMIWFSFLTFFSSFKSFEIFFIRDSAVVSQEEPVLKLYLEKVQAKLTHSDAISRALSKRVEGVGFDILLVLVWKSTETNSHWRPLCRN